MQPYSDDIMIYNELTGRYILTETAIENNGISLRARLSANRTINPTTVINSLLTRASDMIYNYIHAFNIDNRHQDYLIANIPELRIIIYRAMLQQVEYILMNGDLSRSVDKDKRDIAIDASAKQTLETVVPSLGVPITYIGGY